MTASLARVLPDALALYVHVPWCVRKCPYCDFNSHESAGELPERAYVDALLNDLDHDLQRWPVAQRQVSSVFIGGGTPSLLSASAYARLFDGLRQRLSFVDACEITLEANPGTVEQQKFRDYRSLGINRLSIGVQSFADDKLKALGRIHGGAEAIRAAEAAHAAGFDNFNLDLMHGLPGQTPAQALADLQTAIALAPSHLSWYQLTIEANTVFYREAPVLPQDEVLWAIQEQGQALLAAHGYPQYEVSAYAQPGRQCQHNRHYWQFGDYLALGAGAHGKLTLDDGIWRYRKTRLPKDYLSAMAAATFTAECALVPADELAFEFMLNALRLREGVPVSLFSQGTGLPLSAIEAAWQRLQGQGLMLVDVTRLACTEQGFLFLNRVLQAFLAEG